MRGNLILAGVLSIVAALCGNAVAGEINWTGKRVASVDRGYLSGQMMVLKSGTHHVCVVTRSHTEMPAHLVRVHKDEFGKLSIQKVQTQKISKDGVTLFRFYVPTDGVYMLVTSTSQDTERFGILTTGSFIGKPAVTKVNSRS